MEGVSRDQVERLENLRFRLLRAFTIAFTLSYGSSLFLFIPFSQPAMVITILALGGIAWIFFLLILKKLLDLYQVLKNEPGVDAVLKDEFYRVSKRNSLATGFWGFLVACGLAVPLAAIGWVNEVFIIQLVLLIGINTALIKGLILLNPSYRE